ncbi:SGNH/GDSL hydrolase family protein [Mycobacterium sp. SM1]|uniref:Rv0518 family GDSL lipase n=1 Tax=Mycobacterium sp. SM1 TaxID=2816243 RepID=UPI001BCDC3B1|nr:GDSL lipase [Mycobacterium sp. SM1]MBS4729835.1 SGNH/GDSL hydrolase family protein [Mycobacterium sp. SM1]MBS4729836.1 SGNH/GDSL hydrolase family protein [Mycobacterium sp. SM1]
MSRLTPLVLSLALVVSTVSGHRPAVRIFRTLTLDTPLSLVAVIGDSYTSGTDEGGLGPQSWTARAWRMLAQRGLRIAASVAAEGRAGYVVRGDHGSIFEDLAASASRPDDALVVFFGSRNDQGADPTLLAEKARQTFDLARRMAPVARLLVIGPPWPTADAPDGVLQVRDILNAETRAAGATFVDPIGDRWFVGRPDLIGPDGVHPNDEGHAYLADKIAPLIGAQLSRRP